MYQPISPFIFQRPKKKTEVSQFFPVPFYQNALYLRAPQIIFTWRQVGHSNPRREGGIVRLGGGERSDGLGGELVELAGGDTHVYPDADLLRDEHGVTVLLAKPIAELLEPHRDLVEVHHLRSPVPLHDVHHHPNMQWFCILAEQQWAFEMHHISISEISVLIHQPTCL